MKELRWKHRFIILTVLTVLLSVLAYNRAIAPTLAMYQETKDMQATLNESERASEILVELKGKRALLDEKLGNTTNLASDVREELVSEVVEFSGSRAMELVRLADIHGYTDENYTLFTHLVTIEGGFKDLLELQFKLETQNKNFKMASAKYYLVKEKKTREERLYVDLVIQNIRSK